MKLSVRNAFNITEGWVRGEQPNLGVLQPSSAGRRPGAPRPRHVTSYSVAVAQLVA